MAELFRIQINAQLLATHKPTARQERAAEIEPSTQLVTQFRANVILFFENGEVLVCRETFFRQFTSLSYQISGCSETTTVCPRSTKKFTESRSEMSVHSRIELEFENVDF